jgi:hypothetical protein
LRGIIPTRAPPRDGEHEVEKGVIGVSVFPPPPLQSRGPRRLSISRLVLLVAHFFHPIDRLVVELFLNGGVGHGRRGSCAMPVFFAGREPNDIAGVDFFDRSALALGPAAACGGWVCQAVRAPGSKVTLAPATRAGSVRSNSGSMRTVPVNQSAGPFPEGVAPTRLISICFLLSITTAERCLMQAPPPEDSPRAAFRFIGECAKKFSGRLFLAGDEDGFWHGVHSMRRELAGNWRQAR